MKLNEYIENNGLKVSFLSKKLGISRQTIYRIKIGDSISYEVADLIWNQLSSEIELKVSSNNKSHIRNRSKKNNSEMS